MNTPVNVTATAVASSQIATGRRVLISGTFTNTSGSDRYFQIVDAATPPDSFATNAVGNAWSGLVQKVAAGGVWRPLPLDATKGVPFDRGVYFRAFSDAGLRTVAPADTDFDVWIAPMA